MQISARNALKGRPSQTVTVSYTSRSGASFRNHTHTFKGVLVAYKQDGQPVEGGVQLVAPGDSKGGRYVGHLTAVQVFHADY